MRRASATPPRLAVRQAPAMNPMQRDRDHRRPKRILEVGERGATTAAVGVEPGTAGPGNPPLTSTGQTPVSGAVPSWGRPVWGTSTARRDPQSRAAPPPRVAREPLTAGRAVLGGLTCADQLPMLASAPTCSRVPVPRNRRTPTHLAVAVNRRLVRVSLDARRMQPGTEERTAAKKRPTVGDPATGV